jgi:hypothetical protein
VGHCEGDGGGDGIAEGGFGLSREAGDEVDADVRDAGGAQEGDVAFDCGGVMAAAGAGEFGSVERLDSEADAVDSGIDPRLYFGGIERARSGFEGCFAPWRSGQAAEQLFELGGSDYGRCTSAKVDGIGCPVPVMSRDLFGERSGVSGFETLRLNA